MSIPHGDETAMVSAPGKHLPPVVKMSTPQVPPLRHASCSNLSNDWMDDGPVADGETYDVGAYHLTACPICLEHFTLHNPAVVLLCEHVFHLQCLESWKQRSSLCPMCFSPLLKDEGRLMSPIDSRRRRRFRFSAMHDACCIPDAGASTGDPPQQPSYYTNDVDEDVSERWEEEGEVIEITASHEGVFWVWQWLRQCCAF